MRSTPPNNVHHTSQFSRRQFLAFTGAVALAGCATGAGSKPVPSVAFLLPGRIDDGGFIEAGYNGLKKVAEQYGAKTSYIDQVKPEVPLLADALRKLAAQKPGLIVAHGGQNTPAVEIVAKEFPDLQFVVVQGSKAAGNVTSYEVLQEDSAWLAGAAAGLLTKSNVVGHISGIRVVPGLKGRAAYAAGVKHTNPNARLLTNFCGTQDDVARAKQVALAEINAGADVIFTMLNAGRGGATQACREKGAKQIGNVRDWYPDAPDVFIASAIADVSLGAPQALGDILAGRFRPGSFNRIGLENTGAVRLALAPQVPKSVVDEVEKLRQAIVAQKIKVVTEYSGPEFEA
ncbi:MAG: BMP family protein [Moraxellaceae bacterium]|nr:BMP family protein [Moraxellaceae bacterium]